MQAIRFRISTTLPDCVKTQIAFGSTNHTYLKLDFNVKFIISLDAYYQDAQICTETDYKPLTCEQTSAHDIHTYNTT